jgi:hypothetical protein
MTQYKSPLSQAESFFVSALKPLACSRRLPVVGKNDKA